MKGKCEPFCSCCFKPLPVQRRGVNVLLDYCDCICFAAGTTLRPEALHFWRDHCHLLSVSKHQARWDALLTR